MTTEQVPHTTPAPAAPQADLWVERTGRRTYTGRSSRGAEVLIGPVEAGAVFTPGELLKIALAGCTGMSADSALAHRLGEDVAVTVEVEGPSDPDEDRYPALTERLVVDLSSLDAVQRERLLTVVHRAVDGHCTVGRTLVHGATVELTVEGGGR
ncbi:OsmC family protein [Cellulomonas chengniuliangii]|uniref:OsmC family protein n=1 Tax=Cellulomonas chengniuliangii TaxID=2968084 RepID=A0ABY5L1Q3_9CELL|nr:OsmC family protein [Cellulomonas chengniuliangii]MCC2307216.1 OsmC family protein [Cellulomonas chengniuliangii]MCC2317888.1 OsmC family protein [Cellulomonas chengniuliangii]UUI75988.1 OsmC family protein [Cellulomonas chengniuliangii]